MKNKIKNTIITFLKSESGQSGSEYAALISGLFLVIFALRIFNAAIMARLVGYTGKTASFANQLRGF
jgi:hypothetical protein